jgi:hypothetical protein
LEVFTRALFGALFLVVVVVRKRRRKEVVVVEEEEERRGEAQACADWSIRCMQRPGLPSAKPSPL